MRKLDQTSRLGQINRLREEDELRERLEAEVREKQKMKLNFERNLQMVQESLQLVSRQGSDSDSMSEVMTKLEEKHKELITLKLKNEQLREKELYARLHLQDASTNKRQEQLRQELLRQSEANKDLSI